MSDLTGKVAWITGAGSGLGEAAARALADDGAIVVLTGRRTEPLEKVAADVRDSGGTAYVRSADLVQATEAQRIAAWIGSTLGRLDILINNAGANLKERSWATLTPEGVDQVIGVNLSAAFYCVAAVLPIMREQKDGLLIHMSSWAGRYETLVTGATYGATKHGIVAMSQSINMEECVNGIRSCVLCPGEVATPIMETRPTKVSDEDLARMLRPSDVGDLIHYIAGLPAQVCINEVVISPTLNRAFTIPLQMFKV